MNTNAAEETLARIRAELHLADDADFYRIKDAIDKLRAKCARYDRITHALGLSPR